MVALNQIRDRLSAVGNIQKITTSMEMVASARLRKAQEKAKKAQYYVKRLREILERLEANTTDFKHPLFQRRAGRKKGFLIVTSDRGLCGAYNNKVIAAAERHLDTDSELIILGKKGIQAFQNRAWKMHEKSPDLTQQLLQLFLERSWDEVWLVYTQFHHLMSRNVVVERFLPIAPIEGQEAAAVNFLFEPDLNTLYEEILPRYCASQIETVLDQSYAAELAARIFAMKAASQNAEEMVETLVLERNKVRQSNITRELLEMTAAQLE